MSTTGERQQAGAYDPLATAAAGGNSILPSEPRESGNGKKNVAADAPKKCVIEWLTPKEIFDFQAPADYHIVGDSFIFRGGMLVLAGAAGAGKSRALTWLGLCGVSCASWFGMTTHRRFKTMLLQAENDEERLKQELRGAGVGWEEIQDYLRITRIPRFGMNLADKDFQDQLRADIAEFRPDVFGIDPWNRCVSDGMQKDYRYAIDGLYSILPEKMEDQPCLVIGAHTRKPKEQEKANGRELLNLISGSLILGSAARAAMFLENVTSDPTDKRIVCTVAKCNNGLLPPSTAWERANGPFMPLPEFDLEEWRQSGGVSNAGGHNELISEACIRELFREGKVMYRLKDAVARLMTITGAKDKACYAALKIGGRFGHLLKMEGKEIGLRSAEDDGDE
jgi:hypothetical protein